MPPCTELTARPPTNDDRARECGIAERWSAARNELAIEEVRNGALLGGPLFRRTFGAPPPTVPRHFVAFYRPRGGDVRVGAYIHYMAFRDIAWLCGGLCVDRDFYRLAAADVGECVKRMGGLGEIMLRDTFARLGDRHAIFGYCGDAAQWQHDLNIGFTPAGPPRMLVRWTRPLAGAERAALIDDVRAIGAF
jgi:hypothetical protein